MDPEQAHQRRITGLLMARESLTAELARLGHGKDDCPPPTARELVLLDLLYAVAWRSNTELCNTLGDAMLKATHDAPVPCDPETQSSRQWRARLRGDADPVAGQLRDEHRVGKAEALQLILEHADRQASNPSSRAHLS